MNVVSAREFRANQGKFLNAARNGDSLLLTSRYGVFKIVPVTEEDTLTTRICKSLEEVRQIRDGKIKGLTLEDVLNEL